MKWSELTPEQPISPDGWACQKCHYHGYWGDDTAHAEVPMRYSEHLYCAWQVVEKLGVVNETNIYLAYVAKAYTRCEIRYHQENRTVEAVGDTPMEAICKAALKAYGVEIEIEP